MVTNWLAELDGRRVDRRGAGDERQPRRGLRLPRRRARADEPGRGRGPRLEPRRDRADGRRRGRRRARRPTATNRCVLGIEAALREVRGEMPGGRRLADRDAQRDPARARARLVGRGDGRRARRRQRAPRRAADDGRPAPPRDRDRGPSRTTPPRRCSAASRSAPSIDDGDRGAPVRRAARPAGGPVHPRPAPVDRRHARGPAGEGAARGRGRQPQPGRDRRRRDGDRAGSTCSAC